MTEKLKSLGLVELSSLNMNSSKPDIPMSLNPEPCLPLPFPSSETQSCISHHLNQDYLET